MPGMLMKLGWLGRQRAQAHQGGDGGRVDQLHQFAQFLGRAPAAMMPPPA